MPDNMPRNPFEDHINSESFDVSKLGTVKERSALELEMEAFFKTLPDVLDHTLWDSVLDTRQKTISAYITTKLAGQILRETHSDLLADMEDSELIYLLTVPVTLAMIAEKRLHPIDKVPNTVDIAPPPASPYRDDFADLPTDWGVVLNDMFLKAKDFIINLFRRR